MFAHNVFLCSMMSLAPSGPESSNPITQVNPKKLYGKVIRASFLSQYETQ